jgi:hypothetical protein
MRALVLAYRLANRGELLAFQLSLRTLGRAAAWVAPRWHLLLELLLATLAVAGLVWRFTR